MTFYDVVFPLNIGPLTYRRPAGYDGPIPPGTAVRAEVKKTLHYGIVLRQSTAVPKGPVKEIAEIILDNPLYNKGLMSLVSWMAAYYIMPEGIVLKTMMPKEIFEKAGKARPGSVTRDAGMIEQVGIGGHDASILSPIRESVTGGQYVTYLLQTPTSRHEIAYLPEIVRGIGGVIILVPEISFLEAVSGAVRESVGDRLAILHGQLPKRERRSSLQRMISGESDVVLGTRPAIFAPLRSVSLVVVLQEHSRSFKNLEGLRYQARDVAVMRGYLERATVVLSSPTPSLESYYNTLKRKYVLLRHEAGVRRPKIELINMKAARKATSYLSRRSLQAAESYINRGGNAIFLINRKGYSLIQCADCNDVPSCPKCRIPLVYHKSLHKSGSALKCHYCGHMSGAPEYCGKCRSSKFEMVGAGTQRIASDIRKYLAVEPLRFDRDALREDRGLKETEADNIIVGTKAFTGRLRSMGAYDMCVFLNPDIGLHQPDFRSPEMLFQEIFGMSEFIKPEGTIIVQTNMPESSVYKYVRAYRLNDFLEDELAVRKSLMYPPFSRLIGITISSGKDIRKDLVAALDFADEELEVIGPLAQPDKGGRIWKVVLKSSEREKLTRHARSFLHAMKDKKGIRIIVDVDPISL